MEGIKVNITNHEGTGKVFAHADRLANRGPGDPHPSVDPDGFYALLDTLRENALVKLDKERAAANQGRAGRFRMARYRPPERTGIHTPDHSPNGRAT